MQVTFEAVIIGTDRRPFASMLHIGMQEELQVLTSLDMVVEWGVTSEWAVIDEAVGDISGRTAEHAEVEELLQLFSTVGSVVNVYLAVALHVLVVHVVVVLLVFQHLLQVVVVGNAHLNGIRIGLTEIRLIELRSVINAIDVTFSVSNLLEEFPATTRYLVGTRCYMWFTDADERAWQHNLRRFDVLDGRNTTLKL